MHDDIVSVGVVAGFDHLFKDRDSKDLERSFGRKSRAAQELDHVWKGPSESMGSGPRKSIRTRRVSLPVMAGC